MGISVVILTFNSSSIIAETLRAAAAVSDDIHVVDSHSSDNTTEIARTCGASVTQRPFIDYAEQRNWAIANLPLKHDWQLHLDADEILTTPLIAEIKALDGAWPTGIDGFFILRVTRFLGRELRHGGFSTFHMRLFRAGRARVEDRKYDQHFVLTGEGRRLNAPMIDDHRMSLNEWTARHNKWSDYEVDDLVAANTGASITPNLSGNEIERARARKKAYYRAPKFIRAFALFLYRYVLRLGFLDGVPGLIYCFLQTCWYRFLVDAKIYERELREGNKP